MKKMIMFLLLVFAVFPAMSLAQDTVSQDIYSVEIKNESGNPLTTAIPITTIRPEIDKLWGYDCMPSSKIGAGNTETYIGVYDGADVTLTGECFGEGEAASGASCKDRWERGKKIANGVAVRQGAWTEVQIYFIRK